jgi:predicted 3-demethylubiquinone-9 3-methyltransferase (glyoxalase superfamily)
MSDTITPCLWFDTQGEEAATFYTGIFPNSRITETTRYNEAGMRPAGMVMTVAFELDGQPFVALNGGTQFSFSEAVSFQVPCDSQEEVDRYWEELGDGGEYGPCGWLKDRFGVSWQIFPRRLIELLRDADAETGERVTEAMLKMRKMDLETLERAASAPAAH